MKFQLVSDIHLEFLDDYQYIVDSFLEYDRKDTVLIVAGDLHTGTKGINFLKKLLPHYKKIIYVMGNHEYYYNDINTLADEIRNEIFEANIVLLENQSCEIDDVIVIGSTLWSKGSLSIQDFMQMNDYHCIKDGGVALSPIETRQKHYKAIGYLYTKLNEVSQKDYKKVIVATHHLPTQFCVSDEYKLDKLNNFFVADLADLLNIFPVVDYWCYGHTHKSNDFTKITNNKKTRFICNPFDYRGANKDFSFNLEVKL